MSNQHQNFPEPPEHHIVRQQFPEQPNPEVVQDFKEKIQASHEAESTDEPQEKDPAGE